MTSQSGDGGLLTFVRLASVRILFALTGLLAVLPSLSLAQPASRRVLLLYSYEREFAPHDAFASLFRSELGRRFPEPIDFIELSLQAARASRTAPDQAVLDKVRSTIAGPPPDLVVTIGGPAATFAQAYRSQLFPTTPVLLADVDRRFVDQATVTRYDTVVAVEHRPADMIDSILRLLPDTKSIVVVIGSSQLGQFWLKEVQREFARFQPQIRFIWTDQLTYDDLIRRSSQLPRHSAILYGLLTLDAAGEPQVETRTLAALHASANAPLFGLHSSQLGRGIVGGPVLSIETLSQNSVDVAVRLLQGVPPASITVPIQRAETPVFDARELKRWGISESRLPSGSVVQFREPDWGIGPIPWLAALSAVGLFVLIAGVVLVTSRQRRVRTSTVPALALSSLSRRLMQTHEQQDASIARALHEDICQRMMGLTLRLHGISAAPSGSEIDGTMQEVSDQLSDLAGEILAIPDPLYRKLDLLGFEVAARGMCRDMATRHGVNIRFRGDSVTPVVPQPVALALLRVLDEAATNAVRHSGSSEVTVLVSAATTRFNCG